MSRYNRQHDSGSNGGLWAGLIILCIGIFILLRRMGVFFPDWLFSWPMILIAIGFVMGVKGKFQGVAWFIVTFIGCVFLVGDIVPYNWNLRQFLWPAILIVIGIYIIGRATSKRQQYEQIFTADESASQDDFLQATTVFSGTNKVVLSKNFLGGNVTTMFGGTELNFSQADINGEVILEITNLFAGTEIIVPSNWNVKVDINTVFGGIEDKRLVPPAIPTNKTLILKGSCTFGGVDLKSY
ncbi:LiaF transmembrane domain-containing protein [Chitinophaga rhizosphaerae]|uniref:LiaF transmembrane domain-containing protein n=1 Tax=Chitinophaga rhizosphaerae TaxID=1864947 RepID=UPI000F8070CA|nr:DUF5668 domain-containing protein [Chitinophaga rhizosphaerae]